MAHGISLRDLPGTARPERDGRGGREMRCARLLAHALQCIFIRAQRSAAAEDRGGQGRQSGVGVGRMEGGGCEGDERQEERKAEDSVCDRGAKKNEQNSEVVSQTSGSTLGRGVGVGGEAVKRRGRSAESLSRSEVPGAVYHRSRG